MLRGHPVPWFAPAGADPCFCRSGRSFGQCCGVRSAPRDPPAGVQVFPGYLDQTTCRKWIARLDRQPHVRAPVKDINRSPTRRLLSIEDPSRVCDDVKPGVLRKAINDRIAAGFRLAAGEAGNRLAWFETPRILRYRTGGFYLRHADSCQVHRASNTWHKVNDRDLSLLLYLNEDFTGGGLSFINFHFHFRPRAGDLLVFPSDNRYEHQAEVVESGFRYVIASWAALEGIAKVGKGPPAAAIPFS